MTLCILLQAGGLWPHIQLRQHQPDELDLQHNHLSVHGVRLLYEGLKHPTCHLMLLWYVMPCGFLPGSKQGKNRDGMLGIEARGEEGKCIVSLAPNQLCHLL